MLGGIYLRKIKIIPYISLGGVLTALSILLQAAPVFLPGVGLIISPFSTLSIAVAAVFNIGLGISVFITSSLFLIFVSPQEAMILLFTTGTLGVVLGSLLYRKTARITILMSALGLSIGMIILTYMITIPGFESLSGVLRFPYILFSYILFSLLYSFIWYLFFRKFIDHLIKIKLLEKP